MPSIKGQSVVVIGGSSGIGAATAKLACVEGLRVAVASSNRSRVDETVNTFHLIIFEIAIRDTRVQGAQAN